MPGLRALAGYMNTWIDADDRERANMLEEMKSLLAVGQGISGMQATRQGIELKAAEEARTQQQFPYKLGLEEIAVGAAQQKLGAARTAEEHEQRIRPSLVGQEEARATTMGAEAGVAGRSWEARVRQAELERDKTSLDYDALATQYERLKEAHAKLRTEGRPTPEYAGLRKGIAEPLRAARGFEAEMEAGVPELGAIAKRREAQYEALLRGEMVLQGHAAKSVELELEKRRAEIDKLRMEKTAQMTGGKSAMQFRNDMIKEVGDTAGVIAKILSGVSLEDAVAVFGEDSPMLALLRFSSGDPERTLVDIRNHMEVMKGLLWRDFGINYEKLSDEQRLDFENLPAIIELTYETLFPGGRPGSLGEKLPPPSVWDKLPATRETPAETAPTSGTTPAPKAQPLGPPAPTQTPPQGWEGLDINKIIEHLPTQQPR